LHRHPWSFFLTFCYTSSLLSLFLTLWTTQSFSLFLLYLLISKSSVFNLGWSFCILMDGYVLYGSVFGVVFYHRQRGFSPLCIYFDNHEVLQWYPLDVDFFFVWYEMIFCAAIFLGFDFLFQLYGYIVL